MQAHYPIYHHERVYITYKKSHQLDKVDVDSISFIKGGGAPIAQSIKTKLHESRDKLKQFATFDPIRLLHLPWIANNLAYCRQAAQLYSDYKDRHKQGDRGCDVPKVFLGPTEANVRSPGYDKFIWWYSDSYFTSICRHQ